MSFLPMLIWLPVVAVFLLIAAIAFYILFAPLFLPLIKPPSRIPVILKVANRQDVSADKSGDAAQPHTDELMFRLMTKKDIPKVTALMIEAFLTYPSFEYLTDDVSTRRRLLEFIFPGAVNAALQYGYCWVACSKAFPDDIRGEVMYYPELVDLSIRDLLLNGIFTFPIHFGWQMTKDLLYIVYKQDDWKQSRFPNSKGVSYVDFLSTHVKFHNKGIGSKLLENTNELVQQVQKVPLLLNTWQPHEVEFYSKRGFKLVDTIDMPCKRNGKLYHTFWMIKTMTDDQQ